MSSTSIVTPEHVALFLEKLGKRLAPEFREAYARQNLRLSEEDKINRAIDQALYTASDHLINLKAIAPGLKFTMGTPTVSEQMAPEQTGHARPYAALDIKKATPKEVEEHANQLHIELQSASQLLRSSEATPADVVKMEGYVKNAQQFYDQVVERADASGDHNEVMGLFNHRFRRLASDLPSYKLQVDTTKVN